MKKVKEYFENVLCVTLVVITFCIFAACAVAILNGLYILFGSGIVIWYFPVGVIVAILLIAGIETID